MSASFSYTALNGSSQKAKFDELVIFLEGSLALENGWVLDRINHIPNSNTYILFRSGPENPPGFQPSEALEISKEQAQAYSNRLKLA